MIRESTDITQKHYVYNPWLVEWYEILENTIERL